MSFSGYYKFLTGMINVQSVLYALNSYKEQKIDLEEVYPCVYGVSREQLEDEQWVTLISVLKKDGFAILFEGFLKQFDIPNSVIQFVENVYGLDEKHKKLLKIDLQNIRYRFVFDNLENKHFVMVRMEMPLLYQYILDPCITALVYSFQSALCNFIDYQVKYKKNNNFFHKAQCCSPWLEELYCFAFEMVFEADGSTGGCSMFKGNSHDVVSCVPAMALKTRNNASNIMCPQTYEIHDTSIKKVKVCKKGILNGIQQNAYYWRNMISPYISEVPTFSYNSAYVYIDTYYGYSYNEDLMFNETALYGESSLVPVLLDGIIDIKTEEWLRIPFLKIARKRVNSMQELFDLLISLRVYDGELLFRGQTTEYFLGRSSQLMKKLYGDEQAKEPSLASSALRNRNNFEDYYIEWAELIRVYLYEILGAKECERFLTQRNGFSFYYLCLAIAQHYGLPTYGLDASASLSTALFFALFEFKEKDPKQRIFQYIRKKKGESVIYVFKGEPGERVEYDYFTGELNHLEKGIFLRPLMQKASFLHVGWGNSLNACASQMLMAITFDAQIIDIDELNCLLTSKVNDIPLYESFFFPENDPFICFLKQYIELDIEEQYNSDFKKFLGDYIYQVREFK